MMRMRRLLPLAYALALACGSAPAATEVPPGTPDGGGNDDGGAPGTPEGGGNDDAGAEDQGSRTPYDRAVMKSTHNAYERDEPIFDQLVWHRIRSLEVDIHLEKGGTNAPAGAWFVYHEDQPFFRDTSCTMLADCLGQLKAFHAAVPAHEVVTLWIDLKDGPTAGHGASDLDAAITKVLGRDAVFAPADLVARCAGAKTLREAVAPPCGFPALGDLRGKFVVAVTGGTGCDGGGNVARYVGTTPNERLAFGAPNIDAACDAAKYDERPGYVFVNMPYDERGRAGDARKRGLVARIYKGGLPGGLDSAPDFEGAKAAGAQHLATDKVNAVEDGFSTTQTARGYPFLCDDCGPPRIEASALVGMRAQSGDIYGKADSFWFAAEDDPGASVWSAFVAVPSSHVEENAKACLMARASDAPGAPNVAVCRTFDVNPPVLQVRATAGADTAETELAPLAGVSAESPAFLRLRLVPKGGGVDAVAEASADGSSWKEVGKASVGVPLPKRGLAVSSHGGPRVKAIFGNVVREREGSKVTHTTKSLPLAKAVGAAASGDAFDGAEP